jgi:hypothetical protein
MIMGKQGRKKKYPWEKFVRRGTRDWREEYKEGIDRKIRKRMGELHVGDSVTWKDNLGWHQWSGRIVHKGDDGIIVHSDKYKRKDYNREKDIPGKQHRFYPHELVMKDDSTPPKKTRRSPPAMTEWFSANLIHGERKRLERKGYITAVQHDGEPRMRHAKGRILFWKKGAKPWTKTERAKAEVINSPFSYGIGWINEKGELTERGKRIVGEKVGKTKKKKQRRR